MSAPAIPSVLPQADLDFLNEKGWQFEIALHPGEVRIYIRNFSLPEAFSPLVTDLLVRLPLGYRPAVCSANGLPQEEMREPALEDF